VRQTSPAVDFQLDMQRFARMIASSPAQLTYPDLISLLSFSVVFHLLRNSPSSIGLLVEYHETVDMKAYRLDQAHLQGHLILTFSASPSQVPAHSYIMSDSLAFNMDCFDDLLKCVGSCYKVLDDQRCHQISFPCVVLLPDPTSTPFSASISTSIKATKRTSGHLIKVLLLQEDHTQRRTIAAWLWRQGCAVVVAKNGGDAMQHLKTFHSFDLAIIDLSNKVCLLNSI